MVHKNPLPVMFAHVARSILDAQLLEFFEGHVAGLRDHAVPDLTAPWDRGVEALVKGEDESKAARRFQRVRTIVSHTLLAHSFKLRYDIILRHDRTVLGRWHERDGRRLDGYDMDKLTPLAIVLANLPFPRPEQLGL